MKFVRVRTTLITALAVWATGYSLEISAAPLALSSSPLSVSSSVTPNVMLLIDDSYSMNNVIWAPAFNPKTDYASWSLTTGTDQGTWYPNNGNVFFSSIPGCNSGPNNGVAGWKKGTKGTATKCLKLPNPVATIDPAGSQGLGTGTGALGTFYDSNYLNYLFETYADGTDLIAKPDDEIPNDYRMNVARDVAAGLDTTGMRVGLASLNGQNGATIDAVCGSTPATIKSTIEAYRPSSFTPLAEAFYEVTRYFRGLVGYSNSAITYTSPIQYRCQKNFTIIVTDGLPTYDTTFPANDPADVSDTTRALPNWDGLAPATTFSTFPVFPKYSDGYQPVDATPAANPAEHDEAYSLFLDDLVKFGNDIDMKTTGTDLSGGSYQDPKFLKQDLNTYIVGFSVDNQMLQDAAEYGDGQYFKATDKASLQTALQGALSHIQGRTSSSSAVAASTGSISSSTLIYQARFSSLDWSGQLMALPILQDNPATTTVNEEGTIGTSVWDAGTKVGVTPAPASRQIFTYKPSTARGVAFKWPTNPVSPGATDLDAAQVANLNATDGRGSLRLNYLRGDAATESSCVVVAPATTCTLFRKRAVSKLGDIVNSAPDYVAGPKFNYPDIWTGTNPPETAYSVFRTANKDRSPTVYVGANDGMLHAFDAGNPGTGGQERFAYVPNAVFANLSKLTDLNYNTSHQFFVDGSPNVGDAFFGGAWHSILVGGLNNGGKAIYALDVTNPTSFDASKVLWEYTDANDLGFTYSQPAIVRMQNGHWAAVFGNGYNSTRGMAVLFIKDLETGVVTKIDTNVGDTTNPNGLATPTPVDINGDYIIDYIYAGDLRGNMWKFDVTAGNANSWAIAYSQGQNKLPLFTACTAACTTSNRQPITTRPEVSLKAGGGQIVLFGTGKYLEAGDVTSISPTHTFYGIFDDNLASNTFTVPARTNLLAQTVLQETTTTSGTGVRITSNNALISTTHRGWYMDMPTILPAALLPTTGREMQVSTSVLRSGRIIFSTLIPTSDLCGYGGTSWLMELKVQDGSRLSFTPFDLNNDGSFTPTDLVTVNFDANGDGSINADDKVPVSGKKSDQGIISTPTVVAAGEKEYKYNSGSTGVIEKTVENPGRIGVGRQSWRQLL